MDDEDFIRAARVLSSDHGLRILRVFSDDRWKIASEVSSYLDIHTSTASKYLVLLHKGGLLERRTRKTGRRSTFEYHLLRPTIMLELNLSDRHEVRATEGWEASITIFHRLIEAGNELGFSDFGKDIDKLVQKLEVETDLGCLSLFDPKCDVSVARVLARKKIEEGQLDNSFSRVKDVSQVVFEAVKSFCVEKFGSSGAKKIFKSVMSEVERGNGRIVRELGLTGTFERGFSNA
jgi:hypothetical protein